MRVWTSPENEGIIGIRGSDAPCPRIVDIEVPAVVERELVTWDGRTTGGSVDRHVSVVVWTVRVETSKACGNVGELSCLPSATGRRGLHEGRIERAIRSIRIKCGLRIGKGGILQALVTAEGRRWRHGLGCSRD